jgi:hypothetical protein
MRTAGLLASVETNDPGAQVERAQVRFCAIGLGHCGGGLAAVRSRSHGHDCPRRWFSWLTIDGLATAWRHPHDRTSERFAALSLIIAARGSIRGCSRQRPREATRSVRLSLMPVRGWIANQS